MEIPSIKNLSQRERLLPVEESDDVSVASKKRCPTNSSESVQQISNDLEEDQSDPLDNENKCLTTFYGGCLKNEFSIEDDGVEEVELSYDYEVWSRGNTTNLQLEMLEATMIEFMAKKTGLDSCGDEGEDGSSNRRLAVATAPKSGMIHFENLRGVSSHPADSVDVELATCTESTLPSLANRAECVPVKGFFKAYLGKKPQLKASEKKLIGNELLKLIESGMADAEFVGDGDIEKLVYVGERSMDQIPSSSPATSPPAPTKNPGGQAPALGNAVASTETNKKGGLSVLDKGFIAGIGALICIGIAFFIVRQTKKSKKHAVAYALGTGIENEDLDVEDLAPGALAGKDELALQPSLKSTKLNDFILEEPIDAVPYDEDVPDEAPARTSSTSTSSQIRPSEKFIVTAGDSKTVLSMATFGSRSRIQRELEICDADFIIRDLSTIAEESRTPSDDELSAFLRDEDP